MPNYTIDAGDRHEFDRRWRRFTDEKKRMGEAPSIIMDAVMQGPMPDGTITYLDVPPEFVAVLQADKFGRIAR